MFDAVSLEAADNRTRNPDPDAVFAFAVLGPYAEIDLNRSTLTTDDVLRASLQVTNTADMPTRIGLHIWAGLPTGTVVPVMMVPDVLLPPGRILNVPFLDGPFLATFPRGTYNWGAPPRPRHGAPYWQRNGQLIYLQWPLKPPWVGIIGADRVQGGQGRRRDRNPISMPGLTIACRRRLPASARASLPLLAAPDAWRSARLTRGDKS